MRKISFISCLACFALTSFMFSSCGDPVDDEEGGGGGEEKLPAGTIAGVVQKGPFLKGSSVTIYSMDKDLNPTGLSYPTQTTDDMGSYSVSNVDASYVEVKANGYYYIENTGKKSESSINLQAFSQSGRRVNVNLLTTLAYNRIKYLVHSGLSFSDAQNRAQIEVLTALGLGNSTSADFTEMNIAGSGDANGLLLAASLLIQQDISTGDVSKLISDFAADLEEDGMISNDLNQQIHRNEYKINVGTVITGLISFYEENMVDNFSIPKFYNFLDINGDGVMDGKAGDLFKCLDSTSLYYLSINVLDLSPVVYDGSPTGFSYKRTYLSTIPFDVKRDAEWLVVEKQTIDNNIYIVKIEAKPNEGELRTGHIEYVDNSGKKLKTITFLQDVQTQTSTTSEATNNAVAIALAEAQAAAPAGAIVTLTGSNKVTTIYSDNTKEVITIKTSYTFEVNGVSYDSLDAAMDALSKYPAGSTATVVVVLQQTTTTQKYNADGTKNGAASTLYVTAKGKETKIEIPEAGNYARVVLYFPTSVRDASKTAQVVVNVVSNNN